MHCMVPLKQVADIALGVSYDKTVTSTNPNEEGTVGLLRVGDELVVELPRDGRVVQAGVDQLRDALVESAGLDDVGDDDRVGRRSRDAPGALRFNQRRVDRVEPDFRAGGDQ